MWGTRVVDIDHGFLLRFIPTHVGNTWEPRQWSCVRSVHPHACGEHYSRSQSLASLSGSSPRMWGTREAAEAFEGENRFIPTHVGNTRCPGLLLRAYPVHPHACGEHEDTQRDCHSPTGSSPRMWGTLLRFAHLDRLPRFIPTHVGNTPTISWLIRTLTVHPHACGEHVTSDEARGKRAGSSPRMWGTRVGPFPSLDS